MAGPPESTPPPRADHRLETAQKRRERMRLRLIEATKRVFVNRGEGTPVIEDVVREAEVSRGTFYKYFKSLDEALLAVTSSENDHFSEDAMPIYGSLKEPCQRVAVGYLILLVRAGQDPKWSAFFTRMDAWRKESISSTNIARTLQLGKQLEQFDFLDLDCTVDFITGAATAAIQALLRGVPNPHAYMEASVRLVLTALHCPPELLEQTLVFSRKYLADWISGERQDWLLL